MSPEANVPQRCTCGACFERFDCAATMLTHQVETFNPRVKACMTADQMRAAGLAQNPFGRWHRSTPGAASKV